jgi:hypothetical protein
MSSDIARLGLFLLFMMPPAAAGQHMLFDALLKDHVKDGAVDYTALRKDTRLDSYLASVSAIDPASIRDRDDRLAHWINVYNAFTLKLVVARPDVKSIREIGAGGSGPWDSVWIPLGGRRYSLNGIEHDVIRKDFDEPRIHFALVCAARSCPPLRSEAYTGDRLVVQLESNARRFLLDTTANRYDAATNTLYLSQLFSWYGDDFRARYGSAAAYVLSVMGLNPPKPPTVRYLTYDWSLNDHQPPSR